MRQSHRLIINGVSNFGGMFAQLLVGMMIPAFVVPRVGNDQFGIYLAEAAPDPRNRSYGPVGDLWHQIIIKGRHKRIQAVLDQSNQDVPAVFE